MTWTIDESWSDYYFIKNEAGENVTLVSKYDDKYETLPNGDKLIRKVARADALNHARLIAAAPKMLQAIESLLSVIPLIMGGDRTELDEAWDEAYEAIAEAKGEAA